MGAPAVNPIIHLVPPHDAIVFKDEDGLMATGHVGDIGDDFFDLSIDEVKSRQRELRAEVKRLEEGGQLLTRELREQRKESEKLGSLQGTRWDWSGCACHADILFRESLPPPQQYLRSLTGSLPSCSPPHHLWPTCTLPRHTPALIKTPTFLTWDSFLLPFSTYPPPVQALTISKKMFFPAFLTV